jgi:predicted sulfurtransferase
MSLIQLVYTSFLVNNAPDVIAEIHQTAKLLNKSRNITGMLLCANGGILQVLEGDEADVSRAYRSIESDRRHTDVFLISKGQVAHRDFSDWNMGFRRLTDTEIANTPLAAEVFNADRDEIANRVKPGPALAMLVLFGNGIDVIA